MITKAELPNLLTLVALSVILLTFAACSDSTEVAPTASDSAEMTVVEYANWCAGLPDDIDPATWGEFQKSVKPSLDEAEVLIPPMALTDLHDAVLLFLRGSSASASQFDADASYDVTVVLIHGLTYLAQIQEMEGGWDDDVRAALVASGCIGSELIGEEESSGDDPQGDTSTATAALESASTQTPTPTATATPESASTQTPTPTETPIETAPAAPANVRYAFEGSAIRITWDPVVGADYYNVYHDDFFNDACSLDRNGNPRFCEELAASVGETSYAHASPDSYNYYYWVVACNSGGCSEIDSDNPASQVVTESTGPTGPYGTGTPTPTHIATPSEPSTPQPEATQTATATPKATPIATGTSASARDRDGDGLIEVDTLMQLDAMRWDLDGDGISDNADYAAAFSDADTGMLCSTASCAGYELTAKLDFDTNGNGEADEGDAYWNGGDGWIPIGESNDSFDTTFDGGGHTIANLFIRRSPNVGLFGVLGSGSTVSGIGLVDASVAASGFGAAGALAGIGRGVIEDSFADGLVAGCVDQIGGLVGFNEGSIVNSRSAGNVASARRSGGSASGVLTDLVNDLVGFPLFGSESRTCYASGGGLVGGSSGAIAGSHSTSVVSGFTDNFGGLAGVNSGAINASYATGNVSAKACGDCFPTVGGLVGDNEIGGEITNSYATGGVSGQGDNFGGLAGVNSGIIVASYATGSVSGNGFADVGGLVGDNRYTGVVRAAYAEGSVSGRADRYGGLLGSNQGIVTVCFSTGGVPQRGGGLIGSSGNYGAVANCYWDTETSGQSDSAGGDGKTTAELQSPTGYTGHYADWNVDLDGDGSSDDPWIFDSATEYPVLNLGILDIDHGNLNARPPLEPKSNAALCLAVSNGQIEAVNAQIEAGIDVNDTCQTTTLWYNGLTPLAIAMRRGSTAIEAILIEAGAVDTES